MCQFLCFVFAESAFLAIYEYNFLQEVIWWYSSMKEFKIEGYKFCALCALISLFPVELLFCWLWLGDLLFSDASFLYSILLGFLLFRNFVKKLPCLIEVLVLWGIYLWRSLIEEMIPRKVRGRTVRSCIVWKIVSERNFPESSSKCST